MRFRYLFQEFSGYAQGVWLWKEDGKYYCAPGFDHIQVAKSEGSPISETLYKAMKDEV